MLRWGRKQWVGRRKGLCGLVGSFTFGNQCVQKRGKCGGELEEPNPPKRRREKDTWEPGLNSKLSKGRKPAYKRQGISSKLSEGSVPWSMSTCALSRTCIMSIPLSMSLAAAGFEKERFKKKHLSERRRRRKRKGELRLCLTGGP